MKKLLILTLFCIVAFAELIAQQHFSFMHYTSDQGLSQNNVTAMHKDKKGFLWVSTRDGLNRFDGRVFKSYNQYFSRKFSGSSNRFLEIKEDHAGNLWLRSYDDLVYCFSVDTEEFIRPTDEKGNDITDKIKSFFVLKDGTTWLATNKTGCYRVFINTKNGKITTTNFNQSNGKIPSNIVEKVFIDAQKNTWILTHSGISSVDRTGKINQYISGKAVFSFTEDNDRIVFGGNENAYVFNKKNQQFKTIKLPSGCQITDIKTVYPSFYVLTTNRNGFLTYNSLKNEIQHFTKERHKNLVTNDILQTYVDKAGDVWFGVKASGVVKYQTQHNTVEFIKADLIPEKTTNPNMLFEEDENDILWIQSYYGAYSWYDRENNKLIPFLSLYNNDINIFLRYGVNHVIADNQGVMWLSTNRGNGIFKCTFLPEYFSHIMPDKKSVYNVSNEVRAVLETTDKKLWIATKDGKVHLYDQNRNKIGVLDGQGNIRPDASTYFLTYNIFQEQNGDIWLMTKQTGIYRLKQSGKSYNITSFAHNKNAYSPASDDFYSMVQDKLGRLWAGSYGGGLHLLVKNGDDVQFINAANDLKNYPIENCSKVRHIFVDSKNTIWVATTEGFLYFDANQKDFRKIKFNYYRNNLSKPEGISTNDIHFFTEDTEKNIWIATFGGGFMRIVNRNATPDKLEFEKFEAKGGYPGNIYYSILDDKNGSLWLTTENSIIRFNKAKKNFELFGKGNEIENIEFSEAASTMLKSGEICIGSKSGFYIFNPLDVKRKSIPAPLAFTGLKILNKEIEINPDGTLTRNINNIEELEFTHKQNVFTLEFATLDMRVPEKIQYSYMLEGFDKEWNNVGNRPNATYTSLPPGNYVFKVKSTDSEGVWVNNERQLNITVLPSFWQSIYAKIIYFLLIVLVFYIALQIVITIITLKNNVQIEKEMSDVKLRFFTDISHELRTPLTLISLPVDNVLKEDIAPQVKEQMKLVRTNLDKVMSLINQILDFRKLQNNKMQLCLTEINFGDFVENCVANFQELAHAKKIELSSTNNSAYETIWADSERLESIIQNLLSNALKYTLPGKKVKVFTENNSESISLKVIDEGVGIPQEKISFIFERFFSIPTLTNFTQKSTGIGLELVKKITELHHAQIQVDSKLGVGTSFTVTFLKGKHHFDNDLYVSFENNSILESKIDYQSVELISDENADAQNPLILIVEDNDELRNYLCASLNNNFRVADASNGKKAWKKIETIQPEIIVTDLRMPEMDGMELIRQIRSDNRTSHIPVILHTAVTDEDSRIEGMKLGVDDYITKPFNGDYLLARIENLLAQRNLLQQHYRSKMGGGFSQEIVDNPGKETENQFMIKLIQLMNDNMENYDLTIETLSSEFNMSRTIFFTKLKSLTGLSPVEFIRESRLQRAVEYLLKTDLSVSEISYRVGIEDPRYFSRIFKLRFGDTPSEFRNKQSKI